MSTLRHHAPHAGDGYFIRRFSGLHYSALEGRSLCGDPDGQFLLPSMAYIISLTSVTITDPVYKSLGLQKVLIPGFGKTYVYLYSVVAIIVFLAAIYIAKYTRFGRTCTPLGTMNRVPG
jgi:hypothetical protein